MKNFFSDIDIQRAVDSIALIERGAKDIALSYVDVKALMNLAVETAIGNPKAQAYVNDDNECEQIDWFEGRNIKVDDEFIPLYSVKELDN